ncbi:MAG: efflux RND transporter periplasmic adaptor subunit [Gammaproteobacteria bacterium]|nr:efflux RND transporter periplasmic adaptor subunit [Gammaproteobacteria bacterium]
MRFSLAYISRLILASLWLNVAAAEADKELQLAVVERINIPLLKQFIGTVEAVNKATMKAQTSGRLAEIYFDVDDIVKQGEVLARFRNERQQAELDLANAGLQEAIAEKERSQADYDRYQNLYEQKLVAVSTVDQARAALKTAKARLDGARARIKQAREDYEYTIIRAPYSGIVTKRHVEVGESVNPGSPLVSGISLDVLRVVVEVPQSLVENIRTRHQAMVYLADGSILKSENITVFPFADDMSHSFTVRVELPADVAVSKGSNSLYPGMLVKTGFVAGEQQLLVIPAEAMAHRGEMNVVYVKSPDGRIVMRQVRPGNMIDDKRRVIHAGLTEGENIYLNPLAATVALKQRGQKQSSGNADHD